MILFLLGIKRGDTDGIGVTMVGDQDLLITAVRLYGEAPSVFHVDIQYWFGPNVHFFDRMGGSGVRGPISGLEVVLTLDEELGLVLVERMPCQVWERRPLMFSLAEGKYLAALM